MGNEDQVDLFSKPVHTGDTAPSLADGRTPRGLTPDGWVRTTGWLQFGSRPVSSSLVAAVAGLLGSVIVAAALMRTSPAVAGILVLTAPVVCGGAWWLFIARLKPASPARNLGTKHAEELTPGDNVRLHGSIGPVGQVAAVTFGEDVEVDFRGGAHESWPRCRTVQLAQLLG